MSRRLLFVSIALLFLSACSLFRSEPAGFWRPISEPNLQLPIDKAQQKLDFDVSQCRCGVFPTTIAQNDLVAFQPDKQRLAETSLYTAKSAEGCAQDPNLIAAECMRARGWEITKCSGRIQAGQGVTVCAAASVDGD